MAIYFLYNMDDDNFFKAFKKMRIEKDEFKKTKRRKLNEVEKMEVEKREKRKKMEVERSKKVKEKRRTKKRKTVDARKRFDPYAGICGEWVDWYDSDTDIPAEGGDSSYII